MLISGRFPGVEPLDRRRAEQAIRIDGKVERSCHQDSANRQKNDAAAINGKLQNALAS